MCLGLEHYSAIVVNTNAKNPQKKACVIFVLKYAQGVTFTFDKKVRLCKATQTPPKPSSTEERIVAICTEHELQISAQPVVISISPNKKFISGVFCTDGGKRHFAISMSMNDSAINPPTHRTDKMLSHTFSEKFLLVLFAVKKHVDFFRQIIPFIIEPSNSDPAKIIVAE